MRKLIDWWRSRNDPKAAPVPGAYAYRAQVLAANGLTVQFCAMTSLGAFQVCQALRPVGMRWSWSPGRTSLRAYDEQLGPVATIWVPHGERAPYIPPGLGVEVPSVEAGHEE